MAGRQFHECGTAHAAAQEIDDANGCADVERPAFPKSSVVALAADRAQAQAPLSPADLPAPWDVDRAVVNLENACWGAMASPSLQATRRPVMSDVLPVAIGDEPLGYGRGRPRSRPT